MTQAVARDVSPIQVLAAVARFAVQDWGDATPDSIALNQEAISNRDGSRLMGVYPQADGRTLWIICDGFGNDPSNPDLCHTTVPVP